MEDRQDQPLATLQNDKNEIPARVPRKHRPNDIKYLTEDEISALFSVITSIRDQAIFRVVYHRGLRASEPRLLQLADTVSA